MLLDWLLHPERFPSRNKHFARYDDAAFERLTKRYRRLRGLVRDLRSAHPSPVRCRPDDDVGADDKWWFGFAFGFTKRDTRLDAADVVVVLRALEGTPMHTPFVEAWSTRAGASSAE